MGIKKFIADFHKVEIKEFEFEREDEKHVWYIDPSGEEKKMPKDTGYAAICDTYGKARQWLRNSYTLSIAEHTKIAARHKRFVQDVREKQERLKKLVK